MVHLARSIALAVCLALVAGGCACALDYPNRVVKLIVSYPAGGATDILARLIGQWLSERLGQQFIIDNRAGGGNNIGTEAAINSPPDGYTLFLVNPANTINATLYKKLPFNFIRDMAPVAGIIRNPNVMVVNPAVPAKTVAEFIAYAKANPGKINMASSGTGTSIHLSGELFKALTGIEMLHVPYRGSAPAITDLLGGQVQVLFDNLPSAIQHIRSGGLRPLGVTTAARLDVLPDVPAIGEIVTGYEASGIFGLAAPRGTPKEIIDLLNKEVKCGAARPGGESALDRTRRDSASDHARGIRQNHRRGNREVGEGGEVLGRQRRLATGSCMTAPKWMRGVSMSQSSFACRQGLIRSLKRPPTVPRVVDAGRRSAQAQRSKTSS
jgi:tripartite-type tricarboxylate transporter receptor subunit TctC